MYFCICVKLLLTSIEVEKELNNNATYNALVSSTQENENKVKKRMESVR